MGQITLGFIDDEKRQKSSGFCFHCMLLDPGGDIQRPQGRRGPLKTDIVKIPQGIYEVAEVNFLGQDHGPRCIWKGIGIDGVHAERWIILTPAAILSLPSYVQKSIMDVDSGRPIEQLIASGELFIGINAYNVELWERSSLPENAKESRLNVCYQPDYLWR